MVRLGVIGVGGISAAHLGNYGKMDSVQVVALCDIIPARAEGRESVAINIASENKQAIHAKAYLDYRQLLADPEVEVVDICLPTDLHAEVAIAALHAGKHVLSEKPMARTVEACDRMIAAAEATGNTLMIAQCIRFWPEYVALKEILDNGAYGKLVHASFTRLSPLPTWSSDNWLLNPARSGGALLDLHVHDTDYIAFLLGVPKQVDASGVANERGVVYVSTRYGYADQMVVEATGGWDHADQFPFRMVFALRLEHASIEWDGARGPMMVYPDGGEPFTPALESGDGYSREIDYFIDCIQRGVKPTIVTPQSARDSVRIALAEETSLRLGKPVAL